MTSSNNIKTSSIHHHSDDASVLLVSQQQQQYNNDQHVDLTTNATTTTTQNDDPHNIRHRGRYQQQQEQEHEPLIISRQQQQQSQQVPLPSNRTRVRQFMIMPRLLPILSYLGIGNSNGIRFEITQQHIMDAIVDFVHTILEYFVYFIGPLLICLALGIVTLLSYTFFIIVLPMIYRKHLHYHYILFQYIIIIFHSIFVLFLLNNVLYNYACCVLTKHTGVKYDTLIREFAIACQVQYPETSEQLLAYRRNYHNLMAIRMKRRQERLQQQAQLEAQQALSTTIPISTRNTIQQNGSNVATTAADGGSSSTTDLVTTNINATILTTIAISSPPPTTTAAIKKPPPVRLWTLMLPYEWGYCSSSKQPKPPRSHYDHVTKQLVLNLDHYCPWMFNVIGYFNYRYFVNFLIYIFIGMLYGTLMLWEPFSLSKTKLYKDQIILQRNYEKKHHIDIKNMHNNYNGFTERLHPMMPIREEKMLITLSFMLCAAVGIAVFLLGSFHIYLIITSQTTIEFHNNFHQKKLAKKNNNTKWINPYSLKYYSLNWEQVYGVGYGKNILCILLSLLPSSRERDYYPAPVPGNEIRFTILQKNNKKWKIEKEERLKQQQIQQRQQMKKGGVDQNNNVIVPVSTTTTIPTGTEDMTITTGKNHTGVDGNNNNNNNTNHNIITVRHNKSTLAEV